MGSRAGDPGKERTERVVVCRRGEHLVVVPMRLYPGAVSEGTWAPGPLPIILSNDRHGRHGWSPVTVSDDSRQRGEAGIPRAPASVLAMAGEGSPEGEGTHDREPA